MVTVSTVLSKHRWNGDVSVLHRYASELMGCVSLYSHMLAIVQTFNQLQLTFNELTLLRCEALLNAGRFLAFPLNDIHFCAHLTSLDRTLLSTYVRLSVCQTRAP